APAAAPPTWRPPPPPAPPPPPRPGDQADQRPPRPLRRPRRQRVPPDEVAGLIQPHHASEPCFVRCHVRAEFIAVQRHAGLKAERIAGREPGRREVGGRASQSGPDPLAVAGRAEDLVCRLLLVKQKRD